MRAVLLNSGGKDSLAAAIILAHDGFDLHSVFVHTGAPEDSVGWLAAAHIAEKHCVTHHNLYVSSGPYLAPTTRLAEGWNYTTIPFKAIVMFALGGMYAVTLGVKCIASGMRADIFPEDFPQRIEAMYALSDRVREPLTVVTPLGGYKGRQGELNEVIWNTIKDDPLWRETSYCNEFPACGICYGCRVRKEWMSR